jgi:hypothetical protein
MFLFCSKSPSRRKMTKRNLLLPEFGGGTGSHPATPPPPADQAVSSYVNHLPNLPSTWLHQAGTNSSFSLCFLGLFLFGLIGYLLLPLDVLLAALLHVFVGCCSRYTVLLSVATAQLVVLLLLCYLCSDLWFFYVHGISGRFR